VNPGKYKNFRWLREYLTNSFYRVQNFELHFILKNCFKNNRFIEFCPKRLKIMNPIAL
jgi:hypothetical protein